MLMRRPCDRQQMHEYIVTLKKTINAFERQYTRNIYFFNELCFYDHLRRFPLCGTKKRGKTVMVEDMLDALEPYIPLKLTEENFELFLRAVQDTDNPQVELPDYFTYKARIDFVITLRECESVPGREWLVSICDAIRELKEELDTLSVKHYGGK